MPDYVPPLTLAEVASQERAVAAFFAKAEAADPERAAATFAHYPVLTERQIRTRKEDEARLSPAVMATYPEGYIPPPQIGQADRRLAKNRPPRPASPSSVATSVVNLGPP